TSALSGLADRRTAAPQIGAPRGGCVKLYSYFRSSAAYRARIALNLKGIAYEMVSIHLTKDGGRQFSPEYKAVNAQMRVPALELDGGEELTQSLAIIDYLDERHPRPPFLRPGPVPRANGPAGAPATAWDGRPPHARC